MIRSPHALVAILAYLVALRSIVVVAQSSSSTHLKRPKFDLRARVKQHRAGAMGNLVPGEEELRKIILSWDHYPNVAGYEVCHNCIIDEDTGERNTNEEGTIIEIAIDDGGQCGGKPCLVLSGAPIGYNVFHLRYLTHREGEWSAWSKHRNFHVQEVGYVDHEEL